MPWLTVPPGQSSRSRMSLYTALPYLSPDQLCTLTCLVECQPGKIVCYKTHAHLSGEGFALKAVYLKYFIFSAWPSPTRLSGLNSKDTFCFHWTSGPLSVEPTSRMYRMTLDYDIVIYDMKDICLSLEPKTWRGAPCTMQCLVYRSDQ